MNFSREWAQTPPIDHQSVKESLSRLVASRAKPQKQAEPFSHSDLQKIIDSELSRENLAGVRNAALFSVAYECLMRRSEIAGLMLSDVHFVADDKCYLKISESKSDIHGEGVYFGISTETTQILNRWITLSGIQGGRLFRSIKKSGVVGDGITGKTVYRLFRGVSSDGRIWTGHSARVGAAMDLARAEIPAESIAEAGRWQTADQVERYTRKFWVFEMECRSGDLDHPTPKFHSV